MKYSYTKALKAFTKVEKDEISNYLRLWTNIDSKQKKVFKNCKREFYLRKELFIDLFKLLIAKSETDPLQIKKIIFDYFFLFKLSGGKPNGPSVKKIGFCLTEHSLRQNIIDNYFDIFSYDHIELDHFISDLAMNKIDPYLDFISVKDYDEVLWLTFDYSTNDPFSFLITNERKEIYTALALSHWYRDTPIMLFTLPVNNEISEEFSKATTFDAGEYEYFKPPSYLEKDHGYTNPHNGGKIRVKGKTYNYDRRPEIVCNAREIKYRQIEKVKSL